MLSKEFDSVTKYDGAILAIEFTLSLCGGVLADYDSARAGMIILFVISWILLLIRLEIILALILGMVSSRRLL